MESLKLASLFFNRHSNLFSAFAPPPSALTDSQPSTATVTPAADSQVTAAPADTAEKRVLNAIQRSVEAATTKDHKIEHDDDSRSDIGHSAQRILNRINKIFGQLIKQGAGEEDKSAFFHKVRDALHEGFSEAHEIHRHHKHGATAARDTIATQAKVEQGVDQLQTNSMNTAPLDQPATAPQTVTENSLLAAGYMRKDSSELQITTSEGDVVTIRFDREVNRSIAAYQSITGDKTFLGIQKERFGSTSLNISVEGDLNKDELNALRELVHRVERVADKFFKGKDEALQNKLANFNFDNEQIAGFSLNLQSEVSKVLVAAQQKISVVPTTDSDTNATTETAEELQTIAKTEPATDLLSDPQDTVNQVFNNSVTQKLQQLAALVMVQTELRQLGLTTSAGDPDTESTENQQSVTQAV